MHGVTVKFEVELIN